MAIRIEERFGVNAPPDAVWSFLVDPRKVVTCLPGAQLLEVIDERTFEGCVKVKVGAVVVTYKGRIRIEELDERARRVEMQGAGRESAGAGSARMRMSSTVSPAPGGAEVVVHAEVDVAGRIVQLGRGLVEQVSHQIFGEFSACVRATLEAAGAGAAAAASPAPPRRETVAALPLLFRALWAWVLSLLGVKRRDPAGRPGSG